MNIFFLVLLSIGYPSSSINTYSVKRRDPYDTEPRESNQQDPIIEVITPEVYYPEDSSKGYLPRSMSRMLRVKITGSDGSEKIELRIPVSNFAQVLRYYQLISVIRSIIAF